MSDEVIAIWVIITAVSYFYIGYVLGKLKERAR
jgi:hypothetical protein